MLETPSQHPDFTQKMQQTTQWPGVSQQQVQEQLQMQQVQQVQLQPDLQQQLQQVQQMQMQQDMQQRQPQQVQQMQLQQDMQQQQMQQDLQQQAQPQKGALSRLIDDLFKPPASKGPEPPQQHFGSFFGKLFNINKQQAQEEQQQQPQQQQHDTPAQEQQDVLLPLPQLQQPYANQQASLPQQQQQQQLQANQLNLAAQQPQQQQLQAHQQALMPEAHQQTLTPHVPPPMPSPQQKNPTQGNPVHPEQANTAPTAQQQQQQQQQNKQVEHSEQEEQKEKEQQQQEPEQPGGIAGFFSRMIPGKMRADTAQQQQQDLTQQQQQQQDLTQQQQQQDLTQQQQQQVPGNQQLHSHGQQPPVHGNQQQQNEAQPQQAPEQQHAQEQQAVQQQHSQRQQQQQQPSLTPHQPNTWTDQPAHQTQPTQQTISNRRMHSRRPSLASIPETDLLPPDQMQSLGASQQQQQQMAWEQQQMMQQQQQQELQRLELLRQKQKRMPFGVFSNADNEELQWQRKEEQLIQEYQREQPPVVSDGLSCKQGMCGNRSPLVAGHPEPTTQAQYVDPFLVGSTPQDTYMGGLFSQAPYMNVPMQQQDTLPAPEVVLEEPPAPPPIVPLPLLTPGIPIPPPGEGRLGPYLRFAGYHPHHQVFEVTVLFGLHQSRSTRMCGPIAPTLKLTEDGRRLAKNEFDVGASHIEHIAGWNFWRFALPFECGAEERVVLYRMSTPTDHMFTTPQYHRITIPGVLQKWHWGFHSSGACSLPGEAQAAQNAPPLWTDVSYTHTQQPIHVLVGAGDPLRCDPLWQLPAMMNWVCLPDYQMRITHPFTPDMEEQLTAFFFDVYTYQWGSPDFVAAARTIPQVMVWDDQSIMDCWGSYPDWLQATPVFQGVFAVARRFYALFQHHTRPERAVYDNKMFGAAGGWNWITCLGQTTAMIVLDGRSERTRQQVMAPMSMTMVQRRLAALPKSVRQVVIVSSQPVLCPKISVAESAIKFLPGHGRSRFASSLMLGKSGLADSLCQAFNFVDFPEEWQEHWSAEKHVADKYVLIGMLQDMAATRSIRFSFLSGGLRVAAVSKLVSAPTVPFRADHRYMTQIISSGMASPPAHPSLIKAFVACSAAKNLDAHTKEMMVHMFGRNEVVCGDRNWCLVSERPHAVEAQGGNGALVFQLRVADDKQGDARPEIYETVVPALDAPIASAQAHLQPVPPAYVPNQLIHMAPALFEDRTPGAGPGVPELQQQHLLKHQQEQLRQQQEQLTQQQQQQEWLTQQQLLLQEQESMIQQQQEQERLKQQQQEQERLQQQQQEQEMLKQQQQQQEQDRVRQQQQEEQERLRQQQEELMKQQKIQQQPTAPPRTPRRMASVKDLPSQQPEQPPQPPVQRLPEQLSQQPEVRSPQKLQPLAPLPMQPQPSPPKIQEPLPPPQPSEPPQMPAHTPSPPPQQEPLSLSAEHFFWNNDGVPNPEVPRSRMSPMPSPNSKVAIEQNFSHRQQLGRT